MRAAIITYAAREDGHQGGVPKWAWYLRRALDEAGHEVRHYRWRDYPDLREADAKPEREKAALLSGWVAKQKPADHYVVDGFWGCGLPDDANVTSVAHGAWAGLFAAIGGDGAALIAAQGKEYRRRRVIAVSESAAEQVRRYHGAEPLGVIPNGVDLDLFAPIERPANETPVALYAGRGIAKGEDIVREAARILAGRVSVEHLNAPLGMESRAYQRGDVFLHPSRHEGDSYACLEPLATGLPIVTSDVGRFASAEDVPGLVLRVDAAAHVYAAAVMAALRGEYEAEARAWAEKHADYRDFARRWVNRLAPGDDHD